jgi:anti-anti-sigma factor
MAASRLAAVGQCRQGLPGPTPGEPSSGISVNRHQEASHERPCNAGHHRAAPEIDITNASDVAELITAACAPGVPVVIADLTATSFCDSTGLRHLIQASDQAADADAERRLAILPDPHPKAAQRLAADSTITWAGARACQRAGQDSAERGDAGRAGA